MDRIDALRLFLDVAEAGSFSVVARQRVVAPSTVALGVSQLEEELGTRLIIRSTRKLVFTHEGETLLGDARRILAEWDAAVSGLKEDGPLSGPIRVSTTNDFGRRFLRPLLDMFQEDHPGVHVTLLLSDSNVDLVSERIDLALRNGPLPDSGMRARLLIRGPRLVCASPGYWASRGKPSRPEDLVGHNCIILARPGAPLTSWPFRDGGNLVNIKVSGDRQASDGDLMRVWALAGRGVMIKNIWEIRDDLDAGLLETALEDFVAGQVDLFAITPNRSPSRRTAALAEFLLKNLREPVNP